MRFDANVTDVNTMAVGTTLTVSGVSVMNNGVSGVTISGTSVNKGQLNIVGARGANVSVAGNTITIDGNPPSTSSIPSDFSILTVSGIQVDTKGKGARVGFVDGSAGITWTNMPAAATFFNGNVGNITKTDLSDFNEVRFMVNKLGTAGSSGSTILSLRYATSYSTTATNFISICFPKAEVVVNVTNTFLDTGWQRMVAGAKSDVFLVVVGSGGNGTADPIFGNISAEFR